MDHLSEPFRDPLFLTHALLVEPIVRYDFEDFESFASRMGEPDLLELNLNPAGLARCLQSWLFFGLLAEYLGEDFRQENFVQASISTENPSVRYLSLRNLPSAQIDHCTDSSRLSRWKSRAEKASSIAWAEIHNLEARGLLSVSPAGETALAVLILVKSLQIVSEGPSRDEGTPQQCESSFLRRQMVDKGWCPHQVYSLFNEHDPLVLSYLAGMDPNRRRNLSHENCSERHCVANNVKLDSGYHQRHVTEACSCDSITVDTETVKNIIKQGGIPLVCVSQETCGTIRLDVTTAGDHSRYVAISHVWSDGLGNPTANSLPQCQLENLHRCVSQMPVESDLAKSFLQSSEYLLSGIRLEGPECEAQSRNRYRMPWSRSREASHWFWMDTLCIPVAHSDASDIDVAEVNHVKSLAINQMGLVYAAASQVLVLDAELQSMSVEQPYASSDIEPLARLLSSAWMQRCWTLQEGALGKSIRFQTASGLITPLSPPKYSADQSMLYGLQTLVPWLIHTLINVAIRNLDVERVKRKATTIDRSSPILAHIRYQLQRTTSQAINVLPRGPSSHSAIGQALPQSQLRQFCTIWNSLTKRNTTMAEDVPAIFANLLSIHAYHILASPSHLRMLVVLTSLELLPLTLLFNDGPRPFAAENGRSRWVPSETSQTKMHIPIVEENEGGSEFEGNSLIWTRDRQLQLKQSPGIALIRLEKSKSLKRQDTYVVTINGDGPSNLPRRLVVFCNQPENDKWILEDGEIMMLLLELGEIEDPSNTTKLGCALGVTDYVERNIDKQTTRRAKAVEDVSESLAITEEVKTPREILSVNTRERIDTCNSHLVGRYDCPVRWRAVSIDTVTNQQVVQGHTIKDPWKLRIAAEVKNLPKKSHQRPHPDALTFSIFGITGIFTFVPMVMVYWVCIGIRIAIEVRLGSVGHSTLRKVSIAAFVVDSNPLFAFLTPPPVLQALFIADRWYAAAATKSDGRPSTHSFLTNLQAIYIALSLACNVWTICLVIRLSNRYIKRLVRRLWLDSFRPVWKDDQGSAWRFVLKLAERWKILGSPIQMTDSEPEGNKALVDFLLSKKKSINNL
ncbi:hypothetical protein F5Y16DRAFT_356076 [Xylariaceae sp. FL0255]|nr:hypothetical protein F5Y16DRAFT_356076 [Xylariaceae sp. FL0255]